VEPKKVVDTVLDAVVFGTLDAVSWLAGPIFILADKIKARKKKVKRA
jgi:hypothetical protein